MVTVWGVLRFAAVKVTDAGDTVPSVVSELESPTVTFAVGCDVRTIVNRAVPPASVVVTALPAVTVMPPGSTVHTNANGCWLVSPVLSFIVVGDP
jgi:hypothetical protein